MSFVIVAPEMVPAAATDLARIGSSISAANAGAALPTTQLLAAGVDEVLRRRLRRSQLRGNRRLTGALGDGDTCRLAYPRPTRQL